jgi:thiamine-phosphate pyrophosphorylase
MHKFLFKKYYFIEKFYKSNIDKQAKNTTIIYRNYKTKINTEEILILKEYCKNKGLKFLLSNHIKLSIKLRLDGVYLPAFNNSFIHLSYKLRKNFLIVGSAHNLHEIRTKEKQGVSEIFVSSIFKKNNNFLGINKFKLVSNLSKKKIIALGGVSIKNMGLIKLTRSVGFAGISYFK